MAGSAPSETLGYQDDAFPLPTHLARVLEERFPDEPRAAHLVGGFLALNRFDRRFAAELVLIGRDRDGATWNLRLLAALMLANQCLRLTPGDAEVLSMLFGSLGLLPAGASQVDADVLRQGYTSAWFPAFRAEFLGHLRRLERIHRRIDGFHTAAEALDDFISISRDPCKVALARYLFTPEEVVECVQQQLQVSMGISLPLQDLGEDEAERHLKYLPAYEREIVRRLSQGAPIYWACGRTPSTINRLIEGPLGTVACVIKPPGSALEFEIKRTGVGGAFPLTAIFTGFDGNPVPPSHRLRGGASTASLRWEGEHAAILSMVYRIAHGSEASISKLLTLAGYRTVPCAGREVHLVDYFTDSKIFGPEYSKMRGQMKLCVAAFDQQYGSDFTHLPGEVGLTGQFLYHVLPCQGLLAQTTSFRLDTLAGYLSADGADIYFRRGLNKASFSPGEARRFADALLDEVLGIYCAPDVRYVDHAQYIAAAFAVPENRRRADRLHAEAAFDLGRLWGTVLALGGFTDGESFVGRNLGLKSRFTEGEWTSQLISMDHDNLHIPDEEDEVFWAQGALRSAVMDEAFIRGNPRRPKQVPRSSLHFLERIYHLEYDDAADRSRRSLEAGMTTACQQTRRALAGDPRLARLFSPDYLRHLRDWHTVAADYLNSVRLANEADFAAWQERTQAYLAERNYSGDLLVNYCRALEKHSDFVRRYSFLYLPAQP